MTHTGNNRVVGIIGAGAAGLCAARHVHAMEGWTSVVWEQASDLGGTWRLSQEVGTDMHSFPVHSSLYNSLRTDLPAVLMAFPDYKFPEGESFMHHTVVLKYLEDYAHHFNLLPFIKFGHRVEGVSPTGASEEDAQWTVTVKDLSTGNTSTATCHALLICNGHFSDPSIPCLEGIDNYLGKTLHSHDYREPSAHAGSCVVVLGSGPSGLDISLELSSVAKKVLFAHTLPLMIPSEFPPNVHQVPAVVKADKKGFVFADGTYKEADTLIYCTGYKYNFPFLVNDCGIQVKDNHVKNLYKHIINIRYPTMGFIGLPSRVIVFPFINYQVQYFLAVLRGEVILPSSEEMLALNRKIDHDRREQGLPEKYYHTLGMAQFQYMSDLAKEAGLEEPPAFMSELFKIVVLRLFFSYSIFKNYAYNLAGDGSVVERYRGQIIATRWDLTKLVLTQALRFLWRDFPRVMYFFCSLLGQYLRKLFRFSK